MWPSKKIDKATKKYQLRGKIQYSTKNYSNPLFSKKKKKKISAIAHEFSIRTKFILLAFLMILIFFIWLLFYSNFFIITKIEVQGGKRVMPETIEKIAWQQIRNSFFVIFPQKNIYLFNRNKLTKELEKKYSFDSLIIKKKLPHTLIIQFTEKEYAIIWHEDDKYYYGNENGLIISEVNLLEIQQKDYPIIDNLTEFRIYDDKISLEQDYVKYIINLFQKFKDYEEDYKIVRYIIDSDINTVKVGLENGPIIYFNINETIEKQVNNAKITKAKLEERQKRLEEDKVKIVNELKELKIDETDLENIIAETEMDLEVEIEKCKEILK